MLQLTKKQRYLVLLSLLLATIAEASSLLYPQVYVPKLIQYFGYSQEEVGYYVGLLNSSRYIGNLIGALFWSALSDSCGRRPVILINLTCSLICNALFAFATNLPVAMAARLLTGATSALIPLCKTVVYEVSDSDSQIAAMSAMNFGFVGGVLLAVNIGAFLSNPYEQFGHFWPEIRLLRRFPYALPPLVYCCYCSIVLALCFHFLVETSGTSADADGGGGKEGAAKVCADVDGDDDDIGDAIKLQQQQQQLLHKSVEQLQPKAAWQQPLRRCKSHNLPIRGSELTDSRSATTFGLVAQLAGSCAVLVDTQRQCDADSADSKGNAAAATSVATSRFGHICRMRTAIIHIFTAFPQFRTVLLCYTITASATIMFDECVSVFALDTGAGLGLMPAHLGIINTIAIISMLPFVPMLPLLTSRLGPMRIHMVGLLIGLVTILSFPLSVLFHCPHELSSCITSVGCLLAVKNICLFWCFTTSSVLLNNSVPPSRAGTANGIGIMCSNISRIIGITVGTSLLQFTMNREMHYPLDANLVFVLIGSMMCVCAFVQSYLPLSIEWQVHKL